MTPTQKRVFTLLASAQEPMKVELAIADDLKKVASELNGMFSDLDSAYADVERLESEYKQFIAAQKAIVSLAKKTKSADKVDTNFWNKYFKLEDLIFKYELMAEKIGINPNQLNEYNEAKSAYTKGKKQMTGRGGNIEGRLKEVFRNLNL
jgi:hypothetical protein